MGKAFNFAAGAFFGAAAGTIAGIMLAPRSGAETRAMAADIANDAWDNARDVYEQGVDQARAAATDFGPMVDAKADELRAKVDLARERMDQLRDSLSDVVTTTSAQVQDAVNAVADQVAAAAEAAPAAETPAEAVRVEVVDAEAPETGAEA